MTKRLLPSFMLFFLCSASLFSQMDLLWARVYSERATVNSTYPGIYGMTTDRLGNAYFTRNDRMSPLNGYRQITVSKLDPDGFLQWITPVSTDSIYYSPNLYYEDLAVDSIGNVYVVENGSVNSQPHNFSRLTKISPSGSKLWTRDVYAYNLNASLPIERIAVDDHGEVFVFYRTAGPSNPYHFQCHIAKLDSSGTVLSDTVLYQTGSDRFPYFLIDHSQGGFLAACGNVQNNVNYSILSRINPDGSIAWSISENKLYLYVTLDANDNIYVLYMTGFNGQTRISKKDPYGNLIWDILSPNQYTYLLLTDDAGNCYFPWDNGDIEWTKLDTAGQELWRRTYTPPIQGIEKVITAEFENGCLNILGIQTNIPNFLGGPHRAIAMRMDTSAQVLGAYFHPMAPDLYDQYSSHVLEVGQDGSMVMSIGSHDQTSHLFKTCGFECGYNIEGNVTYDADGDCNLIAGQPGFQHAIVGIDGGQAYTMTDQNGNFRLRRDSGWIDIEPILPISYLNACQPNSYQLNITPQNYFHDHIDFVVVGNPFINAAVSIESIPPRVARFQDIDVEIGNLGTLPVAPLLELSFDPRVSIVNNGPNDSIVGNRLFRQLPAIPPFSSISLDFSVLVDTFIPLGEVCTHYAYLHGANADVDTSNNQDSTEWLYLTSYDPNDKSVQPSGSGDDGLIDFDSLNTLTYRIRFQNTGNAVAYNVMIRDTISPLLDLSTFEMGVASHNYRLTLGEGRVLTWQFDNIYLPDSTTDLAGSNGYLKFRIKPQPGLPLGTQLGNQAAIYFDYNLPVITNTALLTYSLPLVQVPSVVSSSALELFPNPAQGRVTLRLRDVLSPQLHVQVCDLRGAVLVETPLRLLDDEASLDISALPPGIYLVQASQGAARHVQRLLVW